MLRRPYNRGTTATPKITNIPTWHQRHSHLFHPATYRPCQRRDNPSPELTAASHDVAGNDSNSNHLSRHKIIYINQHHESPSSPFLSSSSSPLASHPDHHTTQPSPSPLHLKMKFTIVAAVVAAVSGVAEAGRCKPGTYRCTLNKKGWETCSTQRNWVVRVPLSLADPAHGTDTGTCSTRARAESGTTAPTTGRTSPPTASPRAPAPPGKAAPHDFGHPHTSWTTISPPFHRSGTIWTEDWGLLGDSGLAW